MDAGGGMNEVSAGAQDAVPKRRISANFAPNRKRTHAKKKHKRTVRK